MHRNTSELAPLPLPNQYDYVLVGGGLQNGLMALALLGRKPYARIALIERDQALGGNHTWCFHQDDVPPSAESFVAPLIAHRWPGYAVRFAHLNRELSTPYACATTASLQRALTSAFAAAPESSLMLGASVTALRPHEVELADGRILSAKLVIDARGPLAVDPAHGSRRAGDETGSANAGLPMVGYQKFVGQEIELAAPHGLIAPILMDATVPQDQDGFRFFYVLPLGKTRLLIEETYYSDTPDIAAATWRANIAQYARSRGYLIQEIVREECGVLPIPWGTAPNIRPERGLLVAGYRGGFFHPTTGYSFPIAVRLADLVSRTSPEDLSRGALAAFCDEHERNARFCRSLNQALFTWFLPEKRHLLMERFYRLPAATIRRFYALSLTRADKVRIYLGQPVRGMPLRGLSLSAALSRREGRLDSTRRAY